MIMFFMVRIYLTSSIYILYNSNFPNKCNNFNSKVIISSNRLKLIMSTPKISKSRKANNNVLNQRNPKILLRYKSLVLVTFYPMKILTCFLVKNQILMTMMKMKISKWKVKILHKNCWLDHNLNNLRNQKEIYNWSKQT